MIGPPRPCLITLGVADVALAREFYQGLGFVASGASQDGVVFFDAGGVVLALYGREALAIDAHVADSAPGFAGFSLAHNCRSEADVDAMLAHAVDVGGKLLKPAQAVFWGGYSGYFADLDGHIWEVAFNPFFALDADGRIELPPTGRRSRRRHHTVSHVRGAKQKHAMNHDSYSDDYIARILRGVKSIAMIGASAHTNRPSYFVMKYLLGKGYRVIPVNPALVGQEILGQQVYGALADVPGPVEMVDIFRNSDAALAMTREAIDLKGKLGITVVWMQLGVRNDIAAAEAEAAGLDVVMHRCPKIEYGRLSGEIGWAGVNSGRISSVKPILSPLGVQNHRLDDK